MLHSEAVVIRHEDVYQLLNPRHNKKLQLPSQELVSVALIRHSYTPVDPDSMQSKRDFPDKLVKGSTWNKYRDLPPKKAWKGFETPQYVALVAEENDVLYAKVYEWAGGLQVTGAELAALTCVGALLDTLAGVFQLVPVMLQPVAPPLPEIAAPDLQVEAVAVEPKVYTGDKFTTDPDTGHFIGDDGFKVPKDFNEFYERFPQYIVNWVKRRIHSNVVDAEVEDWSQDLIFHMKYLPVRSKYRAMGLEDVIQTFDPLQQYGASERRFRHYVNMCLTNKFNTLYTKRIKNPLSLTGNYSLAASTDPEFNAVVDDEWVHGNSEALNKVTTRRQKQMEDSLFAEEFYRFVETEDADYATLLSVAEAIKATGTLGEAARFIQMSEPDFNRYRNRLRQLGECFVNDYYVPKQRKPYKRRVVTEAAAVLVK